MAGRTRSAQALLASHDAHPPLPPPQRTERVALSWACGAMGGVGRTERGGEGGGGFTFTDGNHFVKERNDEAVEVLVGVGNLHVWG